MEDCDVKQDVSTIKTNVDKIIIALLGDEFSEDKKGLIQKFYDLKEEVRGVKNRQYWLSGASAVAGFVLGVVLKALIG